MGKHTDPLDVLEAFVARYKTKKDAAFALNIGQSYLGDLLEGRRDFSDQMLEKLGLKRVVVAK